MFDVIVIGGGPAGMSAALMLARCRRSVLLCDSAQPRNHRSRGLHGYLTRDGITPAAFNQLGRAEIAKYEVELRAGAVASVKRQSDRFEVTLADGRSEASRFLLIATGVTDDLPAIPGFEECYGRSVFHCPYCDGWESRDRPIAAYGRGRKAVGLALGLCNWSRDIVLCSDGAPLARDLRERLTRNGVEIRIDRISALEHRDGTLSAIRFAHGDTLARDVLFFASKPRQRSDLAHGLGCSMTRHGTVKTGTLSETNVPRVYVAGDASRDAQFVVVAAGEGVKAAVAINQALQKGELVS
jgi:thioredoxin reductase